MFNIKILLIILFLLFGCFSVYAQENPTNQLFTQNQGIVIYNPPYYVDYGYLNRKNDFQIFFPYLGIGIQPTKFSISFFAQTGIQIFYKDFTWRLEYYHAFIPELKLFDYTKLQYFGQTMFIYNFNTFRISSLTRVGEIVYAFHSSNETELKKNAHLSFGIKQIFSIDSQLYHDELTILTSMLNIGFDIIPLYQQSSFFIKAVAPITFDFIHSKLGFMGTIFYTQYLSKNRSLIIGESYSGYDEAIDVSITNPQGLFNKFYQTFVTFDFIYRIYMRFLPSPFKRFYVAVGGNIGIGYDDKKIQSDFLGMGTVAVGYELYGTLPFELRFTLDQDRNFFFNISVISPIAHRFDNNLD